jgi:hypothetical protein
MEENGQTLPQQPRPISATKQLFGFDYTPQESRRMRLTMQAANARMNRNQNPKKK